MHKSTYRIGCVARVSHRALMHPPVPSQFARHEVAISIGSAKAASDIAKTIAAPIQPLLT
ncbi:MAG: hypothetical protein ACREVY_18375 [Gammaproteobacteria bacterium]